MSNDISGFGVGIHLVASGSFPVGFSLSQFADDVDPTDLPEIEQAVAEMGLNGDLVTYNVPVPITLAVAVIPNSSDDKNLSILAERNRTGRGKSSSRDKITVVKVYPNGNVLTLTNGVLTSAPPGLGIASSGRLKTRTFTFKFENKIGI